MPAFESDSSGEETESFTTTNVLLGYASKEPTDDEFSRLGGFPTWLDESSAPSAELAKCKVCKNMMMLLLQLNGDLPEKFPGHERKLYIFSCKRKACRKKDGTIRAVRGVKISKTTTKTTKPSQYVTASRCEPTEAQTPQNLGNSLFNSTFSGPNASNTNPFSTSPSTQAASQNPFSTQQASQNAPPFSSLATKPAQTPVSDLPTTFASKARISSPPPSPATKEPWPPSTYLPTPYPSYYLDADYECLYPDPPTSSKTVMQLETEGPSSSKDDEKDAFESTIDKIFQKFADRLAQNPEQVLRYEFGGSPLLYSKLDTVGKLFSPPPTNAKIITDITSSAISCIPLCPNCTSPRVFELQLVPQAIAELDIEEEGLEGMEWGTVVLGVCGRDCGERGVREGETGWVEEWVGVQWEEDGKGGKA